MKRLIAFCAMALTSLVVAGSVHATAIDLTFENIAPYPNESNVLIEDYYNGGTSSIGTSGPNLGITFSSNAQLLCLNTAGVDCDGSDVSRGGAGDAASQEGALFYSTGDSVSINDSSGFTQGITFEYVSLFETGTVDIWSGLNGTGTLLATASLAPDAGSCLDYDANYCPFSMAGVNFAGTAQSITFVGDAGQFVFDDITLSTLFTGTLPTVALPEPATWALMLVGFGLIGAFRRRRGTTASAPGIWHGLIPALAVQYATIRARRS